MHVCIYIYMCSLRNTVKSPHRVVYEGHEQTGLINLTGIWKCHEIVYIYIYTYMYEFKYRSVHVSRCVWKEKINDDDLECDLRVTSAIEPAIQAHPYPAFGRVRNLRG